MLSKVTFHISESERLGLRMDLSRRRTCVLGELLGKFKSNPPHQFKHPLQSSKILETLLFLRADGYPEVTIETVGRRLRNLGQDCDHVFLRTPYANMITRIGNA